MKKETYEKIFDMIGAKRESAQFWDLMGKLITLCTGICYFVTLFGRYLLAEWKELGVLILVPGVSFGAVSIFRKIYNAQRPYEVYGFQPLIQKDTKGKSFPSRHVFSIFVIAVAIAPFYPNACVGLGFAGVILGVLRVITGVHFPKDVIAGALMGIFFGGVANILFLCL